MRRESRWRTSKGQGSSSKVVPKQCYSHWKWDSGRGKGSHGFTLWVDDQSCGSCWLKVPLSMGQSGSLHGSHLWFLVQTSSPASSQLAFCWMPTLLGVTIVAKFLSAFLRSLRTSLRPDWPTSVWFLICFFIKAQPWLTSKNGIKQQFLLLSLPIRRNLSLPARLLLVHTHTSLDVPSISSWGDFSCSLWMSRHSNKKISLLLRNCSSACPYKQPLRTKRSLLLKTHAINICWNEFSCVALLHLWELITIPSCKVPVIGVWDTLFSLYLKKTLINSPKMLQGEFPSGFHFESKWTPVGIGGGFGECHDINKRRKRLLHFKVLGTNVLDWRFSCSDLSSPRVLLRGRWAAVQLEWKKDQKFCFPSLFSIRGLIIILLEAVL